MAASPVIPLVIIVLVLSTFSFALASTKFYTFNIGLKEVSRLCSNKSIPTVNGQFPGPSIVATEGDHVLVKVVNNIRHNVTIHWHGVRQMRNGWADGPAYITQCPIQTGKSYLYNFTVSRHVGTLFWHAHLSWLRATLYGPIIIRPSPNSTYPFKTPYKDVPIILGEWWKADAEGVIAGVLESGGPPPIPDAFTINGLPGYRYPCSGRKGSFVLTVIPGKTYFLRIINAALNTDLFFAVSGHTLVVVEADAAYVKPFRTRAISLSAGQTTGVLLRTGRRPRHGAFTIAAHAAAILPFTVNPSTVAGILRYSGERIPPGLPLPRLPAANDTAAAARFRRRLHALDSPSAVPRTVDRRLFFAVGLGTRPCTGEGRPCRGPGGMRFSAAVNNVSFDLPSATSILEARYFRREGVYTAVSGESEVEGGRRMEAAGRGPAPTMVGRGTRVVEVEFNSRVEIVMQNSNMMREVEFHPVHLHGYNFFVVGEGAGRFTPAQRRHFDLKTPPLRNTALVPAGGWVALRFTADNPGVWFMHCHIEVHASWGLATAILVKDGVGPDQVLPPPPSDLPQC